MVLPACLLAYNMSIYDSQREWYFTSIKKVTWDYSGAVTIIKI